MLAGLSALDVLNAEGDSVTPANYAVVLTAGAFTGSDAADRNATLADLVSALDSAGSGAVVAGDIASAAETGLVGVIRADPTLSAAVSTVDNVEHRRRADQHRPGARPGGRGHVREVRHRGGHPAGPAGARADAVSAARNARLGHRPGRWPPAPPSPAPPR